MSETWIENLIRSVGAKIQENAAARELTAKRELDLAARWQPFTEELIADVKRAVETWNGAAKTKGLPITLRYDSTVDGFTVNGVPPISATVTLDSVTHGFTVARNVGQQGEQRTERYEARSNGARISVYRWATKGGAENLVENSAQAILAPLIGASLEAVTKES